MASIDLDYVVKGLTSTPALAIPRPQTPSQVCLSVLAELAALSSATRNQPVSTELKRPSHYLKNLPVNETIVVLLTSLRLFNHLIPVKDLVSGVILLPQSYAILSNLISQNPQNFLQICQILVQLHRNEMFAEPTRKVLLYACDISHQRLLRAMFMEAKVLPDLCCYLTLNFIKDQVLFLNTMLDISMAWTLATTDKRPFLSGGALLIREYLPALVESVVEGIQGATHVELKKRLRAICGLVGMFNQPLSERQLDIIMTAISYNASESLGVDNLCFMLICWEQLVRRFTEATTIEMVSLLLQTSQSHITMLICIHIFTDSPMKVAEHLKNHLQMNILISSQTFSKMHDSFRSRLLSVAKLCQRALELRFEDEQVRGQGDSISISLVSQMLAAQMFQRSQVDVGPWMQNVIMNKIALPLHSSLTQLLSLYVEATLTTTFATRIPEIVIAKCFEDTSTGLTPRHVVMLLYLLLHNFSLVSGIRDMHGDLIYAIAGKHPYPMESMDSLSIKRILLHARVHAGGKTFESLYPQLGSLVSSCFPELVEPLSTLREEAAVQNAPILPSPWYAQQILSSNINLKAITSETIRFHLLEVLRQPSVAERALDYLASLTPEALLPYYDVVLNCLLQALPTIDPKSPVWHTFQNIWQRLNRVRAPDIWVKTVGCLSNSPRPLTLSSMIESPQNQVDVDRRVYRRPVLVDILLQILTCLLTAAKSLFRQQIRTMSHPHLHPIDITFVESAIIRFLLEACVSTPEDSGTEDSDLVLQRIRKSVCDYIHSRFVIQPNLDLMKKIHIQSYAMELVPVILKGVPSMHVMDVKLRELYAEAPPQKWPFITELARQLADNNPTARVMALVAQATFPAVDRMAGSLPNYVKYLRETRDLILPAPPSLMAFPGMDYLAPHVLSSLVDLCGIFWDDYNKRISARLNDLDIPLDIDTQIVPRTPRESMDGRTYEFLVRTQRSVRECKARMLELQALPPQKRKKSNR
ncbi:hypothetical protein SeMB42_g01007 [Synchytrium endobioticum]|uniref:Uncharacterized protein n=1 Tax=Synchytrium endobioticum TaxID=286115 RepID=A0A507DHQ6_9FUNG|nr:hypothetical protein SeLEV6574_g00463 [Synchytrium endobioticum]TPX53042.1 hypothetical protein SeMB42_g01007 [Synchytrium endobioticum]